MNQRRRRRTIQATLVLGVTFALGAVFGAGFWQWGYAPSPRRPGYGPIPVEELDLTPEQYDEVESIVRRYRPQVRAVFEESQPRIEAINAQVLTKVREILTEEQRGRLDAIRQRRGASGGPPGGGYRGGRPPPRGERRGRPRPRRENREHRRADDPSTDPEN